MSSGEGGGGGVNNTKLKYHSFEFTALTWQGSVIGHVLPKVIFFILWSLAIILINRYGISLKIPDTFITLMVLILSLLLVFRTNTAYDRYWEGRRIWSNMTIAIRSMSRNIWTLVDDSDKPRDRLAKTKAINLLAAYPFCVKRYLREEYGTQYDDIIELLDHIPRYATPSSLQPRVEDLPDQINSPDIPLQPYKGNPATTTTTTSPDTIPTNLPLEIAYCLSSYIAEVTAQYKLTNPVVGGLIANINSLVDCLSNFERILRTPIPTAYSVHLNQSIWLFCLLLPFQLFTKFPTETNQDWVIIPIVALTVFTAFGIVNIGEEIENPFGYDANDLPLDHYCQTLKAELLSLTSRPPPSLTNWVKPTTTLPTSTPLSPPPPTLSTDILPLPDNLSERPLLMKDGKKET